MLFHLPKVFTGSSVLEIQSETSIAVNGEVISIEEETRLTEFVREADDDGKMALVRITNWLLQTGINAVMVWQRKSQTSTGGWAVYRNNLIHITEE